MTAQPINLTPNNGEARPFGGTGNVVFAWALPGGNSQDSFNINVNVNATNELIVGGGASGAAIRQYTLAIPGAYKGQLLRWQMVIVLDGVQGPFSQWAPFYVGDVPVVTITTPAEAAVVAVPQPSATWSRVVANGAQTSYQVKIEENVAGVWTLVHDSGVVASDALSYNSSLSVLRTARTYRTTVTITDSLGLSGSDINTFTTVFAPPTAPDFTVMQVGEHVEINWTDDNKAGGWSAWRVYRKNTSTGLTELLYETEVDVATYTYEDWRFSSGEAYGYTVVQVANEVESVHDYTDLIPVSDHYWLIHPSDPTRNLLLSQVEGDDPADEYEEAELLLIGRGRKYDIGTHWGIKGTLSCTIWDRPDMTAREQALLLRSLKAEGTAMYLRNPFGDIWMVAINNVQMSRIPGAGRREHHTLSVPYSEIR